MTEPGVIGELVTRNGKIFLVEDNDAIDDRNCGFLGSLHENLDI